MVVAKVHDVIGNRGFWDYWHAYEDESEARKNYEAILNYKGWGDLTELLEVSLLRVEEI